MVNANNYVPKYLPDGTIKVQVTGFPGSLRGLQSVPMCLDPLDSENLFLALADLGVNPTPTPMLDFPWSGGSVEFSGGSNGGKVLWFKFTPNGQAVLAGSLASFFLHAPAGSFKGSFWNQQLITLINSLEPVDNSGVTGV